MFPQALISLKKEGKSGGEALVYYSIVNEFLQIAIQIGFKNTPNEMPSIVMFRNSRKFLILLDILFKT